jgi:16S rRNA (adenine1518-N6/adenine1519-N6)-dimethyltransferase
MNNELHKPRKRFGQNFLHDMRIIQRIVSSIAPKKMNLCWKLGRGKAH